MEVNKIFLVTLLLVLALTLFGCTQTQAPANETNNPSGAPAGVVQSPSQIPPTDASAGTIPQTQLVRIDNFSFNPAELTIKKGDKVIWNNSDVAQHTVTSDSGSELASETLPKGVTYEHTFSTVGTYDYHCNFHPTMKGKIIVE